MRTLIAVAATFALSVSMAFSQEAPKKINKVATAYTTPSSGPEMFYSYCAPCHGRDGKGAGPAASALKMAPADLTQLAAKNGGKFPVLRVQQYIRGEAELSSHGSRDMPMWGEIFRTMGSGQEMIANMRVKNLGDFVGGLQQK
jgi:mono/diheme cytochrome c family protein